MWQYYFQGMNVWKFQDIVMKKFDLIEDRWLSIKEIAEYLGVRRENIYVYLEKKKSPRTPHRQILEIQISLSRQQDIFW